MKFIPLKPILFVLSIIFFNISCSKEKVEGNSTILLYKNSDNKDSTSSGYLLGKSVNEVSKIFFNNTLFDSLINNVSWEIVEKKYVLDFNNISLTSYYGSKIRVITIPVKNTSITPSSIYLNIYELDNKFIITKLDINTLSNANLKISVTTINDDLYFEYEMNKFDKIGNWNIQNDLPINNTFYKKFSRNIIKTNSIHTEESFMKCMDRLITQVCGSSWMCSVMCGAALPSCVGGAALACAIN